VAMANVVVGAIRLEKRRSIPTFICLMSRSGRGRPAPPSPGPRSSDGSLGRAAGSPNSRGWPIRSCLAAAQLRPPREQKNSENRQARQPGAQKRGGAATGVTASEVALPGSPVIKLALIAAPVDTSYSPTVFP
jgi:hypothetical protein